MGHASCVATEFRSAPFVAKLWKRGCCYIIEIVYCKMAHCLPLNAELQRLIELALICVKMDDFSLEIAFLVISTGKTLIWLHMLCVAYITVAKIKVELSWFSIKKSFPVENHSSLLLYNVYTNLAVHRSYVFLRRTDEMDGLTDG